MAKRQNRADMGAADNDTTDNMMNDTDLGSDMGSSGGSQQSTGGQTMGFGQSQVDLMLQRATQAIEERINRLQVPREAMQLGEGVVGALLTAQDPVRRAFKQQPVLTGVGLASLATGGILLGLAIARTARTVVAASGGRGARAAEATN